VGTVQIIVLILDTDWSRSSDDDFAAICHGHELYNKCPSGYYEL